MITLPSTAVSDITYYASQILDDFKVVILLILGIGLAFMIFDGVTKRSINKDD